MAVSDIRLCWDTNLFRNFYWNIWHWSTRSHSFSTYVVPCTGLHTKAFCCVLNTSFFNKFFLKLSDWRLVGVGAEEVRTDVRMRLWSLAKGGVTVSPEVRALFYLKEEDVLKFSFHTEFHSVSDSEMFLCLVLRMPTSKGQGFQRGQMTWHCPIFSCCPRRPCWCTTTCPIQRDGWLIPDSRL